MSDPGHETNEGEEGWEQYKHTCSKCGARHEEVCQ